MSLGKLWNSSNQVVLYYLGPVFETEFGKNQTAMTKSHHLSLFEPPKRKELKNQNINMGNNNGNF
jgi:hypothetical protein